MSTPFVAVFMVTYNHEKFISQAIESVLLQETTFPVKLIIGEDCSTDSTADICIKFRNEYPDKIELFINSSNLGAKLNAMQIFNECFNSGAKYIAMLEGDDYWIDTSKLQKQVDFLETNKDFVMTFCNILIKVENGVDSSYPAYQNKKMSSDCLIQTFPVPSEIIELYDIAKGNYIHTPGVVFRNVFLNVPVPKFMSSGTIGDWPLYMFLSRFGKIRYFDEIMAVYRVHNNGLFSSLPELKKEYLGLLQYPAMINEGIFNDKVIQIWEEHVVPKLADILIKNIKVIGVTETSHLLEIYNGTKPSLLKKSIELIIDELTESQNTIKSIQASRTYRLSCILQSIPRFIRKLFSTNKNFRSYTV